MSLRAKTLLIIGVTLAGLATIAYGTSHALLLGGFLRLEDALTRRDLQRAADALADDTAQLDELALGWATWDDTYRFIQDRNAHYLQSNVVRETFENLRLNALVLLDLSGRVVVGRGYDRQRSTRVSLPPSLAGQLRRAAGIAEGQPHDGSRPPRGFAGLALLPEGPMLVAAKPILRSNRQGPARGLLVMGRTLDGREVDRLARVTHLKLSLHCLDAPGLPADVAAVARGDRPLADIAVRVLSENSIAGYGVLKDIAGKPCLLLRLESPRSIYLQGRAGMAYLLIALIVAGVIFGAASLVLMERVVLARLARLNDSMARVVEHGDLSTRVPEDGDDELAGVARGANRMLEALQRRDAIQDAVSFAAERLLQCASWEDGIETVLERLGQAAGVSRAHIFQVETNARGRAIACQKHVWRAPGVEPVANAERFQALDLVENGFQRWLEVLQAGESICGRVRDLPAAERRVTEGLGIRSLALVPIFADERWWGCMVFDDRVEREWSHSEIDALRTAASTLGAAIQRRRQEEERRRLETQVQHAQRLESLGVLAGGIAHDFNNLLMGVLANAELALMKLPADSDVRRLIERIEAAGLRASELTNQMLAYAGKGKFANQTLDLAGLVREMIGLLESSISKKAALRLDFPPDLPPVQGDPSQLRQVVMNLITNASEALSDAAGVITLSADVVSLTRSELAEVYGGEGLPEGRYVALTVSDTGCGMSPSTRARIFDPFFTTKFLGRGLGLAAVLGIVRGHGGAIRVESEPGRGSLFQILLPCAALPLPEAPPEADHPAGWRGQGTILVVDDETDVRDVARAVLEESGYTVLLARDGREGVEVFRENASEIDVVLLDLNMPLMDGAEAFREMQRIRPGTRVILSSGYTEEDAGARFSGTGVAGFIQKPYRPTALLEKLRQLLG